MTRAPGTPPGAPADAQSYLLDLVTNTLDPGYAEAAARRDGTTSRSDRVLVVLGAVLAGLVLVVALVQTSRAAPTESQVHAGLVARVRAAEAHDATLSRAAEQLDAQIGTLRDQALGGSADALREQIQRSEVLAGTLAVTGPGLRVTLTDAGSTTATAAPTGAARPGTTPLATTRVITDRDVRGVVNELWADGAEAIAVNGMRLTPVSAIRFAGQAVLVDFQPVSSPYRIEAIGDADRLATSFADSSVASRDQTLAGAQGVGFDFAGQDSLHLPAAAPIPLRAARPAR